MRVSLGGNVKASFEISISEKKYTFGGINHIHHYILVPHFNPISKIPDNHLHYLIPHFKLHFPTSRCSPNIPSSNAHSMQDTKSTLTTHLSPPLFMQPLKQQYPFLLNILLVNFFAICALLMLRAMNAVFLITPFSAGTLSVFLFLAD
jgi:hypothetical protein